MQEGGLHTFEQRIGGGGGWVVQLCVIGIYEEKTEALLGDHLTK